MTRQRPTKPRSAKGEHLAGPEYPNPGMFVPRGTPGRHAAGRPKGLTDKVQRVKRGSIRAVYRDLIETEGLHDDMKRMVKEGVNNPKRTLGFMELGARVLDRIDDRKNGGAVAVTINFISNIRPDRLRAAAVRARQPALRPLDEDAGRP